ncbi:MAG TPA: hypothetical protein PLR83_07350 [Pyrinomonadaceae bacterium]|nr:hypothetical protein [Pyrinomonadaceae bacterium]
MRTTLTLDDDVAFGLQKLQESESGKSFKEIVNDALRRGLSASRSTGKKKPFKVKAFKLGLREGLSLDNIEELLDKVEGADRKW